MSPIAQDDDLPNATGHDIHFLERLSRVSLPHVELAMSLYRDPGLVAWVLDKARVAAGAPRVAISLDDPVRGPFLVVERNGHFVTCLGEGMTTADLPVVTRGQLDAMAGQVEELRRRMEVARTVTNGEASKLVSRLLTAGDDLTREEFVGASAFAPLMYMDLAGWLFGLGGHVREARRVLGHLRRVKPRSNELPVLRDFWNAFWAIGHLVLLVAPQMDEVVDELPQSAEKIRGHLSWNAVRQGATGLALKGAWAAGRLGKPALGAYKERYAEANSTLSFLNAGMGLVALAARHARLRAEACKALQRPPAEVAGETPEAVRAMSDLLAALPMENDENRLAMDAMGRKVGATAYQGFTRHLPADSPYRCATPGDVPDDLALASMACTCFDFLNDRGSVQTMLMALPWMARAAPEHFYFPAGIHRQISDPWRPEESVLLITRGYEYYGPQKPARAAPKISRNAPCTCGSGKKYKKCCEGKEKPQAEAED